MYFCPFLSIQWWKASENPAFQTTTNLVLRSEQSVNANERNVSEAAESEAIVEAGAAAAWRMNPSDGQKGCCWGSSKCYAIREEKRDQVTFYSLIGISGTNLTSVRLKIVLAEGFGRIFGQIFGRNWIILGKGPWNRKWKEHFFDDIFPQNWSKIIICSTLVCTFSSFFGGIRHVSESETTIEIKNANDTILQLLSQLM